MAMQDTVPTLRLIKPHSSGNDVLSGFVMMNAEIAYLRNRSASALS